MNMNNLEDENSRSLFLRDLKSKVEQYREINKKKFKKQKSKILNPSIVDKVNKLKVLSKDIIPFLEYAYEFKDYIVDNLQSPVCKFLSKVCLKYAYEKKYIGHDYKSEKQIPKNGLFRYELDKIYSATPMKNILNDMNTYEEITIEDDVFDTDTIKEKARTLLKKVRATRLSSKTQEQKLSIVGRSQNPKLKLHENLPCFIFSGKLNTFAISETKPKMGYLITLDEFKKVHQYLYVTQILKAKESSIIQPTCLELWGGVAYVNLRNNEIQKLRNNKYFFLEKPSSGNLNAQYPGWGVYCFNGDSCRKGKKPHYYLLNDVDPWRLLTLSCEIVSVEFYFNGNKFVSGSFEFVKKNDFDIINLEQNLLQRAFKKIGLQQNRLQRAFEKNKELKRTIKEQNEEINMMKKRKETSDHNLESETVSEDQAGCEQDEEDSDDKDEEGENEEDENEEDEDEENGKQEQYSPNQQHLQLKVQKEESLDEQERKQKLVEQDVGDGRQRQYSLNQQQSLPYSQSEDQNEEDQDEEDGKQEQYCLKHHYNTSKQGYKTKRTLKYEEGEEKLVDEDEEDGVSNQQQSLQYSQLEDQNEEDGRPEQYCSNHHYNTYKQRYKTKGTGRLKYEGEEEENLVGEDEEDGDSNQQQSLDDQDEEDREQEQKEQDDISEEEQDHHFSHKRQLTLPSQQPRQRLKQQFSQNHNDYYPLPPQSRLPKQRLAQQYSQNHNYHCPPPEQHNNNFNTKRRKMSS
eukprot:Pgem_evm1s3888